MLSKKYYVKIAQILKENKSSINPVAFENLVRDFIGDLKEDNYRFDPYRFRNYINK